MEYNFSAIIIKVPYDNMADADSVEILGKSMLDWVKLSVEPVRCSVVPYEKGVEIPLLVKGEIDITKKFTVVLFSDTPLMTRKTVLDAVCEIEGSGHNVLKMTRGYVFDTEFLAKAEKIYCDKTHYFNEEDFVTAFDYKQVSYITDAMKTRILSYHMMRGVHIHDMSTTYIGSDVVIERGVTIEPNNTLIGNTIIKTGAKLLAGNRIENSIISSGCTINSSQIYKSYVGAETTVGPYAYIRPDCLIGSKCRIGDFVELKASVIGDRSKVSHLTYIGDCEVGEGCNIGCGVVFANYDGKNKFKSKVGDNVFIGSSVTAIAPIVIGDGAFLAAGSTLNKNVEEKSLAIARARQESKPEWLKNPFTAGK